MKPINKYINEKLKISKPKKVEHTLFPKHKYDLVLILREEVSKNGNECDLNHIDVSKITDMDFLFAEDYNNAYKLHEFDGDISQWDVSNVKNMYCMFKRSNFNGDISQWDVSNVEDMRYMFKSSIFNEDISDWNVSKVKNMSYMFDESKFNQDISRWDISSVKNMDYMFYGSLFNQDISDWDVSNVESMVGTFTKSKIKDEYKPQGVQ